jgi:hypothetical protein
MRVRFKDGADHCVGALEIPLHGAPGRMRIEAVGEDRADAIGRAALVAERIANDPIMSALMPPQAKLAIVAAKGLAAAAKRGLPVLKSFWGKLHGPGKQRLAQALATDPNRSEPMTGDIGDEVGFNWKKAALFAANPFAAASYYGGKFGAKKVKGLLRKKKKVRPMKRPVEPEQDEDEDMPEDPGVDTYGDDDGGDYE